MKITTRLSALILVLTLCLNLFTSALATTEGIPLEDLNIYNLRTLSEDSITLDFLPAGLIAEDESVQGTKATIITNPVPLYKSLDNGAEAIEVTVESGTEIDLITKYTFNTESGNLVFYRYDYKGDNTELANAAISDYSGYVYIYSGDISVDGDAEATPTPEVTATPEATATPEVTVTPEATATPEVVVTPTPEITPEPESSLTLDFLPAGLIANNTDPDVATATINGASINLYKSLENGAAGIEVAVDEGTEIQLVTKYTFTSDENSWVFYRYDYTGENETLKAAAIGDNSGYPYIYAGDINLAGAETEKTDETTGVSISAVLPEDVTLTVTGKSLEESGLNTSVYPITGASLFYDVTLYQNSAEYQPENGITITFPESAITSSGLAVGDFYKVYHIHDDTTDVTGPFEYTGGAIDMYFDNLSTVGYAETTTVNLTELFGTLVTNETYYAYGTINANEITVYGAVDSETTNSNLLSGVENAPIETLHKVEFANGDVLYQVNYIGDDTAITEAFAYVGDAFVHADFLNLTCTCNCGYCTGVVGCTCCEDCTCDDTGNTETVTDSNGNSLLITVPDGAFTTEIAINAIPTTLNDNIITALDVEMAKTLTDYEALSAFDIYFTDVETNEHMNPVDGASVELSFSVPTSLLNIITNEDGTLQTSYINVFHMIENGTTFVAEPVGYSIEVDPTAEYQTIVVEANEFSIYVVANTNTTNGTEVSGIKCVDIGETITLYSNESSNNTNVRWTYTSNSAFDIEANGRYVTITANAAGSITLSFQTRSWYNWETLESITILAGPIKVYVYVGTNAGGGLNWADNEEFLELLGIGADTVDNNNFFPVGEIYLDPSYLDGKNTINVGDALINSEEDWEKLLAALTEMDTSTLVALGSQAYADKDYSVNRGNKVPEYLDQAAPDINRRIGSQMTALFRWNDTTSYGFADQTVKFHLDLRFYTQKITFITGNNGITVNGAKDGTIVDTRVYIAGSEIQPPRNLFIPDGYRFMGYYEDADFTIPWNGIGTPLNEDQIVYIKITEEDNVILNYVVAEGNGNLSSDGEGLNPVTGVATGSIATAAENYRFVGWYADEACTQLLSTNANFVPTKPGDRWIDTTYYAKFELKVTNLILTKTGNVDSGDTFIFKVTITEPGELTGEEMMVTITGNGSVTIGNLLVGSKVNVEEQMTWAWKYGTPAYTDSDDETAAGTVVLAATGNQVTVQNNKNAEQWLYDEGVVVNVFSETND